VSCTRARELDLIQLYRQPGSPACRDFDAHCQTCASCEEERRRAGGAPGPHRLRRWPTALLGLLIAGLGTAVIVWWARRPDVAAPVEGSTAAPAPAGRVAAPDPASRAVRSGETLTLDATSLPSERALVLVLLLPEPTETPEPLPVRIVAADGRVLETAARIDAADRRRAEVAVPGEWLARQGRYIFELKTRERTHLPLRRYAVEIR